MAKITAYKFVNPGFSKGNPSINAANQTTLAVNRLGKRMSDLDAEMNIKAKVPIIKGGALIVPIGFLNQLKGETKDLSIDADSRKKIELLQ